MRGRISPKVIAMMIRNAVVLLLTMLVSRAAGAPGPIETNSTRPVAALNRKKPGINETTAEKATATKGRCRRSTTGVARTLTSMPAAIGTASRRHGIENSSIHLFWVSMFIRGLIADLDTLLPKRALIAKRQSL